MKKKYVKPSMQVYDIKGTPLIVTTSPPYPGELGNIPTVPGQAEEEKQLA